MSLPCQVTHLKQQLAAARAEVACLKKELHGEGRGLGGGSGDDTLVQAAMEELEAQVASSEKQVERLRVEKVRGCSASRGTRGPFCCCKVLQKKDQETRSRHPPGSVKLEHPIDPGP